MILTDQRGNQFNALDPGSAAVAVAGRPRYGLVLEFVYGVPYISLGRGSVPCESGFGSDVVNSALIPGRLEPGRRISGFVYFQKLPDELEEATLKITYRAGEEEVTCSFPFRKESEDEEGGDPYWDEEDW